MTYLILFALIVLLATSTPFATIAIVVLFLILARTWIALERARASAELLAAAVDAIVARPDLADAIAAETADALGIDAIGRTPARRRDEIRPPV